ncbi:hypothetical protein QBC35DRAFT_482633 [Podospora australis]|uniref:Uncharacterized protein n=1 Tax=Podospora australis TaxID=1536484 RepID=A0AAN7AND3_9PEZI|nr:hypothetical protein QBC35DRAFT_482633 [Podospora australis]
MSGLNDQDRSSNWRIAVASPLGDLWSHKFDKFDNKISSSSTSISHSDPQQASQAAQPSAFLTTAKTSTKITSPSGLCEYCSSIDIGVLEIGRLGKGPHAPDLETVKRNAQFCRLCRWLQHLRWHNRGGMEDCPPPLEPCPLFYCFIAQWSGDTRLWFSISDDLESEELHVYIYKAPVNAFVTGDFMTHKALRIQTRRRLLSVVILEELAGHRDCSTW